VKTISTREINRLAIPAVLGGLSEPIISLADTAIVGQLGASSLAAVGLGASVFAFLVWVFASMNSAMASLVGNYLGKDRLKDIESLIPQSVLLAVLIGLTLFGVTSQFAEQIFNLFNAKGTVLSESIQYYSIRSFAFPITLGTIIIFGVFKGYQNTLWTMYITISGGLLNVLLDYLLVYGVEGWIPTFGIAGAAYASIAAQCAMFVAALSLVIFKMRVSLRFTSPNPEVFRLLRMSGNLVIRTVILGTTLTIFPNRMATSYGESAIAAHTIAMNLWLFGAYFIDGYAHAGTAIMGKLLGQNNKFSMYPLGIWLTKTGIFMSIGLGAFYLATYQYIGHWFTSDPEVILVFESIFWLLILSQPLNAIAFIFDGVFIGLGKITLLRNNLLLASIIFFLPCLYLFDWLGWQMIGVWSALTVWMAIRSLPLLWVFVRQYGKQ